MWIPADSVRIAFISQQNQTDGFVACVTKTLIRFGVLEFRDTDWLYHIVALVACGASGDMLVLVTPCHTDIGEILPRSRGDQSPWTHGDLG